MQSDPPSMAARKHTNGWMTVLALGLLAICLLACLYVLIGFPAEAQAAGGSTIVDPAGSPAPASPVAPSPRRQPLASYTAPAAVASQTPLAAPAAQRPDF